MKYQIKTIKDEQAYHHTGIMILIKAIKDTYNNPEVIVGNSLNQGFFVYFQKKDGTKIDRGDVQKIRKRMKNYVRLDLPIKYEWVKCSEAVEIWKKQGFDEKAKLFEGGDPDNLVIVYNLDGYKDYFYSDMLPSTGYYELFELRPYKSGMLLRNPTMLHPDRCQEYRDDDKLYEAFAASKNLRKNYSLDYLGELNALSDDEKREVIKFSEEGQAREIDNIAEKAVKEGRRLVLIAGPSSSGKTTFAKKLCAGIEKYSGVAPIYLGTDDYFLNRADTPLGPDGEPNFEGLDALDLELFNQQMTDLLAGKEVDIPEFDFMQGVKVFGKRITKLSPDQVIVMEGIHSLNDDLTRQVPLKEKFKVYISPLTRIAIDAHNRISTCDARLFRRMVRDNQFRGRDAAQTIRDWPKVRSGENGNIFPYSSMADVVFNSSLPYETSLLKHYAVPLLAKIQEDEPEYEEARRLLEFTNCFREIDMIDAVPQDSILREFIGK